MHVATAMLPFLCVTSASASTTPLNYLTSFGAKADATRPLTWGVTAISVAVIATITLLLCAAIWRRPGFALAAPGERREVSPESGGLNWLWIGVGLSSLVLLLSVVWTVAVLADISRPVSKPSVVIEVTGKQWWWQVRYLSEDPSRVFATANEIHIPTGEPVLFKLVGGDVIHSFWVPALAGKTDTIPGQTNETWLEARQPGTYRGQCTEYCGIEHAHMSLVVIAQSPSDFAAWETHQLQSPVEPNGQALAGMTAFNMRCAGCHAVRGTTAAGMLGPDLSHLMQRTTLGAGTLPNDPQHLAQWVSDPQGAKPGNLMQKPELSGAEMASIDAYLETLQ
ncbi:MAG TPA: cytochrome c oxidase subunit II [Rhizomicrobium sp.]|nr:cytochrome c oxidase subunit II [Rhizomicrobium sp.]